MVWCFPCLTANIITPKYTLLSIQLRQSEAALRNIYATVRSTAVPSLCNSTATSSSLVTPRRSTIKVLRYRGLTNCVSSLLLSILAQKNMRFDVLAIQERLPTRSLEPCCATTAACQQTPLHSPLGKATPLGKAIPPL